MAAVSATNSTSSSAAAHQPRSAMSAAEVELRSALAYCPDNAVAHWLLGNLYYGPLQERPRALRHYEELVRLHPRFEHADVAKERILELTW